MKPNFIIPCAGLSKRFSDAGYLHPKPLILAQGKPILSYVIDNIKTLDGGTAIFILQKAHEETYKISEYVRSIYPNSEFVFLDGVTDGAARTVCYGLNKLDFMNKMVEPLIVLNSDQYVSNPDTLVRFKSECEHKDGNILCFNAKHPKWSYAATRKNRVKYVVEKVPTGSKATLGIYYYNTAGLLMSAITSMISKNIRTNGEFYLCPAYNEIIQNGGNVGVTMMDKRDKWGLGTPEDLEYFNGKFKNATTL